MHIYIGYDPREETAYDVCEWSMRKSGFDGPITRLDQEWLRREGMYWREWIEVDKQKYDLIDGKPFSTEFSFTRFLTPYLASRDGERWALFVDCDFLFFKNPQKLMKFSNANNAVACVWHNYKPPRNLKMDGQKQEGYNRKLWSSLMLFNVEHADTRKLTPQVVNSESGAFLHQMKWTNSIGKIPAEWNWIPDHNAWVWPNGDSPSAIHYTEGLPIFTGYERAPYTELWELARIDMEQEKK